MAPSANPKSPQSKSDLVSMVSAMRERAKSSGRLKDLEETPVQLPMWEDDARALPNSLARGALFTAAKSDDRKYFKKLNVASLGGLEIQYRGEELRQDDASVFMTLLHLARHFPLGQPIHFTAYSMLKELGWSINKAEYQHLKECCDRLSATNVTVAIEKRTTAKGLSNSASAGYAGSLIRSFAWRDSEGQQLSQWYVLLEPKIAQLFSENTFSLFAWSERKLIGGRAPLALWLHSFLITHREPLPISVPKYYELSASRAKDMADFRRRLRAALQKLVDIKFLKSFIIKNDVVYLTRTPRTMKAPTPALLGDPALIGAQLT